MEHHQYSLSHDNSQSLSSLTLKLLDEIVSIFSLNCISPWTVACHEDKYIGTLHYKSFVNTARQVGLTFTASESRAIEKHLKLNDLEYIDIDKFVQLVDNKIKLDSKISITIPEFTPLEDFFKTKLDECYNILDWQKSGKLPTSDMKQMLSCFNDGEFDMNRLNHLFKSADLTNKRIISREDFKSIFLPVGDTSFFSLRLFDTPT